MKAYWQVTYWDNNKDTQCKAGAHSYEEALRLKVRLENKGHSNVQIKSKDQL